MARPDVFDLMRRSLDAIAAEAPQAEAALRRAIGPLRARLTSESGARRLRVAPEGVVLDEGVEAEIEIAFDREVVIDLAEARVTLEEALGADRLTVLGPIAATTRLHEALMIYLEGLMRAPGAAPLYELYCQD